MTRDSFKILCRLESLSRWNTDPPRSMRGAEVQLGHKLLVCLLYLVVVVRSVGWGPHPLNSEGPPTYFRVPKPWIHRVPMENAGALQDHFGLFGTEAVTVDHLAARDQFSVTRDEDKVCFDVRKHVSDKVWKQLELDIDRRIRTHASET